MNENSPPATTVSDRDLATLDKFAEKKTQTNQLSAVIVAEPSIVQRSLIYFICSTLFICLGLLYFAKVPTWVESKGKIISAAKRQKPQVLFVQAKVSNRQIGSIRVGMPAAIEVDAYPASEFGTLAARVQQIIPPAQDESDFGILLELPRQNLATRQQVKELLPGLTVQVKIPAQNRPLFELLLSK
jgi:HlyD family secretion protein